MKISLNGKEYESGKITREKYRKFAEVYEILLGKEKEAQTFSDDDLDSMIEAIAEWFSEVQEYTPVPAQKEAGQ